MSDRCSVSPYTWTADPTRYPVRAEQFRFSAWVEKFNFWEMQLSSTASLQRADGHKSLQGRGGQIRGDATWSVPMTARKKQRLFRVLRCKECRKLCIVTARLKLMVEIAAKAHKMCRQQYQGNKKAVVSKLFRIFSRQSIASSGIEHVTNSQQSWLENGVGTM